MKNILRFVTILILILPLMIMPFIIVGLIIGREPLWGAYSSLLIGLTYLMSVAIFKLLNFNK